MATLIKMQEALNELRASEQNEATTRRAKAIAARITLRNIEIDELVNLTGCSRRVLERKHGDWIRRRIASVRADNGRYEQARMRANASNATSNLSNWK